jgi:hypothetical protein
MREALNLDGDNLVVIAMQNEETCGAYEGGNSYGSLERSQGEKATKVQLIALVFTLTLCACTRTQTTLSGAAAGTRQGLPSLVRL